MYRSITWFTQRRLTDLVKETPSVEFEHCRDLAIVPGGVFEFTSRFLSKDKMEPRMALYALRQAVSNIPYGPIDDSVKWTKLKWWGEELMAAPDAVSRHPVLRYLWQSGVRKQLDDALLLRMVGDALSEMDVAPPGNEADLFERQSTLGATEILLELALDDAELDTQSLDFLGAATSSFHLISRFSAKHVSEAARLPLSLLAKHNITAQQLEQEAHASELAEIMQELAGLALDWYSEGTSCLGTGKNPSAPEHLQLRWAMETRRLTAIRRDPQGFLEAGKSFGPADAWFAWRFFRRLQ